MAANNHVLDINVREITNVLHKDPLPRSYQLELNADIRVISILELDNPHILAQQQFTKNEWSLLTTLLLNYPHYTSLETLLASITSLSPLECSRRIQIAQAKSSLALKCELKPVHRALSGIRVKFKSVFPQLKILFLHETGYMLAIDAHERSDINYYSTRIAIGNGNIHKH